MELTELRGEKTAAAAETKRVGVPERGRWVLRTAWDPGDLGPVVVG
jgi:hypothetical protein